MKCPLCRREFTVDKVVVVRDYVNSVGDLSPPPSPTVNAQPAPSTSGMEFIDPSGNSYLDGIYTDAGAMDRLLDPEDDHQYEDLRGSVLNIVDHEWEPDDGSLLLCVRFDGDDIDDEVYSTDVLAEKAPLLLTGYLNLHPDARNIRIDGHRKIGKGHTFFVVRDPVGLETPGSPVPYSGAAMRTMLSPESPLIAAELARSAPSPSITAST